MVTQQKTRISTSACSMRGRFYMWLASRGESLLMPWGKAPFMCGTFRGWRMERACKWFDFWRGKVWFADRKYAPCTYKHSTEKPCIYM